MISALDDKNLEQRLRTFYAIALVCCFILVGRLWHLQIVQGDYFARLADGNRMRRVRIMPVRGNMLDRNAEVLVRSRPAFTVSLIPGGIPRESQESEEVFQLLSDLLGVERGELLDSIDSEWRLPYEPVRLIRDVEARLVVAIEENRAFLPGVFIEEDWVREYLHGDVASHLIGYLGLISAAELQALGSSYHNSDLVGKTGLELVYEQELRGTSGSLSKEVNALSRLVQTVGFVEPVPGHNLVLAIDKDLQQAAEAAFLSHTALLRTNASEAYHGAYNGAVVAMKPKTGEILAMVSVPGYDPTRLLNANERNTYYQSLVRDSAEPFFNRVTHGQYGPGSIFKPFVAIAMLEEEVVKPTDVFNATGVSQYGVRDWVITQRLAPFGTISFTDAMAVSSNHFFAEFGVKVGIDSLSEWLRDFGFGSPTGILGISREPSGIIPDRQWKRKRFQSRPLSDQVWYPTDTEQVSIGQGFVTVTPLQLAVAYSAIANRGTAYQATVVQQILDPEGTITKEYLPEVAYQLQVAPSTWEAVIAGMEAVITHPRGTARSAFSGFPASVAGKTGSYQIPGKVSHGLFGAFVPVNDPELVVIVVVEHGVGGGSSAAPIARKVFDAYFGFE